MPTVPKQTKCAELGCQQPRSRLNRFCLEHGGRDIYKEAITEERATFNAMYNTAFWRSQRRRQLSIQPICQACISRGIVTPATQVDHLFRWAYLGEQAFTRNIFQSLCHACHRHKTSLEAKGVFRLYHSEGYKDYTLEDYSRVVT